MPLMTKTSLRPMLFLPSFVSATVILLASNGNAEPVHVSLGRTTLVGDYNSSSEVDAFLGVKYANHWRFEHPVLVEYQTQETLNATVHAPACSQVNNATGWNGYGNVEDCLFLEIYRPHPVGGRIRDKYPVLVWIHGGGGNFGSANAYLGFDFVKYSMSIDMPVIVVTINYRLAAWGMLGGKEALKNKAVNLGIYDQRAALEWVHNHIGRFGGDRDKVTLWGESAGSMNSHIHYLDRHSNHFRAAIMQSGNVNSFPAIDTPYFQNTYDAMVNMTGCNLRSDTFKCLKTVELSVLQNAVNKIIADPSTYSTAPWGLIVDEDVIPDIPSKLISRGKFAKKPFISGNVLDEGTLFPSPTPIDTVDAMWAFFEKDYLNKGSTWLSNEQTKAKILKLYPADPVMGSPFNTGNETFGLGAQFKRAAAIFGDIRYHGPRRSWLADATKYGLKGWTYQFSQFTPSDYPAGYGVYHTTDLAYHFMTIPESQIDYYDLAQTIVNYWIAFAYSMDPNYKNSAAWPEYGLHQNLMNFVITNASVIPDTFRKESIAYLNSIQSQFGNPR